jgi:hypothetical protein
VLAETSRHGGGEQTEVVQPADILARESVVAVERRRPFGRPGARPARGADEVDTGRFQADCSCVRSQDSSSGVVRHGQLRARR